MDLATWLKIHDWTNRQFAAAVDISEEYARLLRAGRRCPAYPTMGRIAEMTGNVVTPADVRKAYEDRKNGIADEILPQVRPVKWWGDKRRKLYKAEKAQWLNTKDKQESP